MNNNDSNAIRILYYGGGWPTNIGNAFIDLGAIALLRIACPDAQIAFASEMPRWFFEHQADQSTNKKMNSALDIASVTNCDLVVFAGMAMCEEFVKVNGPSVLALAKKGVSVLLLGTGGLSYDEQEKDIFGEFIRQVNPLGFLSRDDRSYDLFSPFVKHAFKGIDCGFFLSEAYKPLSLQLPDYIVATFDSKPEPVLDLNGRKLIHAHHDCWGPSPKMYTCADNTLISDIPFDYLTLYANAKEVHSDRVHACVATLAYGQQTRLYHPTPRGSLFHAVGAEGIRDNLVQLDRDNFEKKKKQQGTIVKELIELIKQ